MYATTVKVHLRLKAFCNVCNLVVRFPGTALVPAYTHTLSLSLSLTRTHTTHSHTPTRSLSLLPALPLRGGGGRVSGPARNRQARLWTDRPASGQSACRESCFSPLRVRSRAKSARIRQSHKRQSYIRQSGSDSRHGFQVIVVNPLELFPLRSTLVHAKGFGFKVTPDPKQARGSGAIGR